MNSDTKSYSTNPDSQSGAETCRERGRKNTLRTQEEVKRRAGRYTLEEAALLIECEAGERFKTVLSRLQSAARAGELPMHNPGEMFRRYYSSENSSRVRGFYEEVYWDDLNRWLESFEPRVTWRFPEPSTRTKTPKDPARFNHDTDLQSLANAEAVQFQRDKGRAPTKHEVANRLQKDFPTYAVSTIERRIRKKW